MYFSNSSNRGRGLGRGSEFPVDLWKSPPIFVSLIKFFLKEVPNYENYEYEF